MRRAVHAAVALALAAGWIGCSDDPPTPPEEPKTPATQQAPTQPAPETPATAPVVKAPSPAVKPGLTRYVDEARGFAVQHPEGWQVSKSMFSHMPVLFLRPRKARAKPGEPKEFRENFNIGVRRRSKAAGLATVHKGELALLKRQYPGMTMAPTEDLTLRGRPVKKNVLTGKQGERKLKLALYMLLSDSGKRLYVLIATAPAETFDRYAPVFQDAIETLEILAE
jgi:hypothetical protein